jgi:NAD(P)H-hydrate epimerase
VARLISEAGYECEVYLPDFGKSGSLSQETNLRRLKDQAKAKIGTITGEEEFPRPEPGTVVIDGLYGSGLTRPLNGLAAALIRHINRLDVRVVAIDIPSGLMGEDNSGNIPENIIKAHATITLQFPKLSLLFPENEQFAGKVFIGDIGLHPDAIGHTDTPYFMSDRDTIFNWFKPRMRYAHKGDFGHALLIAGSQGKMGAALLASEACLRSGTGLVTTHLPACGYEIQQTYMPEIMCSIDVNLQFITKIPTLIPYRAIGAGPGLGTHPVTREALLDLIQTAGVPLVLDADALNILSLHPEWQPELRPGTILTPHPGEFKRLFGETANSWQRLQLQRNKAMEQKVVIVLKGAHTSVALPDGKVWFNTSGNPGMASGGSGDVLTGIILGLLAQGFPPEQAAIAGVFIHGEAGDIAAARYSQPAMTASDITHSLPELFQRIFRQQESEF